MQLALLASIGLALVAAPKPPGGPMGVGDILRYLESSPIKFSIAGLDKLDVPVEQLSRFSIRCR